MPRRFKVLVVDDEEAVREVLDLRLTRWGFTVHSAADAAEARQLVRSVRPHLVISDVKLPDASGIELLPDLLVDDPKRPVILITAYGSVDTAVEAMKLGACDFLTKPIDYEKLEVLLSATCARLDERKKTRQVESRLKKDAGFGRLIGVSKPMQEVYELLHLLAESEASAIITGESGTGKELAARTIHDFSSRSRSPLIAVNTAAIPEGLVESEFFGHETGAFTGAVATRQGCFELASGGLLFLDEIAEMPLALQPKFLRVLEEKHLRRLGGRKEFPVDVRVLAATNRNPVDAVAEGRLREDLYYRLNVFTVELPPLRRRLDDLPLLSQHFIRSFNEKHRMAVEGIGKEALQAMRSYRWPGNVRELRNVVERAVILTRSGWITLDQLPPFIGHGSRTSEDQIVLPTDVTAQEAERILILETLKRVDNNKTHAARKLGLDVKTIRNKLRSYGLTAESS